MYVWPCPSRPPLGAVQVYVCGHSLGGALATLCAYDLAGRKCVRVCVREKRVAPKRCLVLAVMSSCCSTLLYLPSTPLSYPYPSMLCRLLSLPCVAICRGAAAAGRIVHMFTYGAPRVGNKAFADSFNARLAGRSWRVTNTADIVPRWALCLVNALPPLQPCCIISRADTEAYDTHVHVHPCQPTHTY